MQNGNGKKGGLDSENGISIAVIPDRVTAFFHFQARYSGAFNQTPLSFYCTLNIGALFCVKSGFGSATVAGLLRPVGFLQKSDRLEVLLATTGNISGSALLIEVTEGL